MSRQTLDGALREHLGGDLPSSIPTFQDAFAFVLARDRYMQFRLSNPFTTGRPAQNGGSSVRVRVRVRWGSHLLELPGIYVRDQDPPTEEQALRVLAVDAWSRPFVRSACEGVRGDGALLVLGAAAAAAAAITGTGRSASAAAAAGAASRSQVPPLPPHPPPSSQSMLPRHDTPRPRASTPARLTTVHDDVTHSSRSS